MAHCGAHHKLCVDIYTIYFVDLSGSAARTCVSPRHTPHSTSCCLLYDPIGYVCLAFADFIIIIIILWLLFAVFYVFAFALR